MTESTASYRFVGKHPDDLDDGRVVEPGQFVELTHDQVVTPHNQRLIDDGHLLAVQADTIDATPAAVELAARNGVSLSDVAGTGHNGRITQTDVETHLKKEEQD